ncbi:hypothetical protein [Timonella senegalensis]|uniref:hypothetical protein n=1 Tax=Timonella senegalensis TaxID=1465825 RepID=UPI0002D2ADB6|nr:hypothetical protein [Timonella senegalensis]
MPLFWGPERIKTPGTLKDWEQRKSAGTAHERFVGHGNPLLPGDTPGDVWALGAQDRIVEDVEI